jgi:hypothetical protein
MNLDVHDILLIPAESIMSLGVGKILTHSRPKLFLNCCDTTVGHVPSEPDRTAAIIW